MQHSNHAGSVVVLPFGATVSMIAGTIRNTRRVLLLRAYGEGIVGKEEVLRLDEDMLIDPSELLQDLDTPAPSSIKESDHAVIPISEVSPAWVAGGFREQVHIFRATVNKRNVDASITRILQTLSDSGLDISNMLFSSKDSYLAVKYYIEEGFHAGVRSPENELGRRFYVTPQFDVALDSATIRGKGVVLLFDKPALENLMRERTLQLSGDTWANVVQYFLTHSGARSFTPETISFVSGPMSENHTQVRKRLANPRAATVMQMVVINNFEYVNHAFLGAIYLS